MTTTLPTYKLHLFIPGTPAPQGSKRALGPGRMIESSKNVGPWRDRIAFAAHNFRIEQSQLPLPFTNQPLSVTLKFVMPRPVSTPKTRPTPAIRRPDLDKLVRAVFDACTGIIFTDDAAITHLEADKRLAGPNGTPGVHISIESLLP